MKINSLNLIIIIKDNNNQLEYKDILLIFLFEKCLRAYFDLQLEIYSQNILWDICQRKCLPIQKLNIYMNFKYGFIENEIIFSQAQLHKKNQKNCKNTSSQTNIIDKIHEIIDLKREIQRNQERVLEIGSNNINHLLIMYKIKLIIIVQFDIYKKQNLFDKFMAFFGVELNAQINKIIGNIKLTLNKNKYNPNFRTIYRAFAAYDPQQTGSVTLDQLDKVLQQNGIFFKKFQIQAIQKAFAEENRVNWYGFMSALREPMNELRASTIQKIFDYIDSEHIGQVHYSQLLKKFNVSEFLEFKLQQKSKERIEKQMFDLVPLTAEGYITRQQFFNFYNDLSLNILSDQTFVKFVSSHWNYPLEKQQKLTPEQIKEAIRTIRFKLIQMAEGTHEEYILKQIFNQFDINKNGSLCDQELYTMLVKLEMPTQKRIVKPMIEKLDRSGNGVIEYDEFKNFIFFDPYPI